MHPDRELYSPVYKVGRRPLKLGKVWLQPGDPVAGAENWLRLESRVRTGQLAPI